MEQRLPGALTHALAGIFCLIIMRVTEGRSVIQKAAPGCWLKMTKCFFEYRYYKEGDVIIGGLFTVNGGMKTNSDVINHFKLCTQADPIEYRNLLAFIFAIDEINKNPDILPNITLGYHAFDSCRNAQKAIQSVLAILSGYDEDIPNYSCVKRDKVAGFIGDRWSFTTIPVAQILSVYGYPQISYGASDPILGDRVLYPYFFRTVQDDQIHYKGIVKLLKYFGWNWVGIITSEDENGERELRELSVELASHGICIEFVIQIPETQQKLNMAAIEKATSQVVIACGTCAKSCMLTFMKSVTILQNITIILTASWQFYSYFIVHTAIPFNGSLSFSPRVNTIPGLETFIGSVDQSSRPHDPLLNDIYILCFGCLTQDTIKNTLYQYVYEITLKNCTEKENITYIEKKTSDVTPYHVYTAVHVMAHALYNMYLSLGVKYSDPESWSFEHIKQLHNYVRKIQYTDCAGKKICFNEGAEIHSEYHLLNYKVTKQGKVIHLHKHVLGVYDTSLPEDRQLSFINQEFFWKTGKVPRARCSDRCPPGSRKIRGEGYHTCCYGCVSCSEGEVSDGTDSIACQKCPDDEWPDKAKVKCLPKSYDFLSYEEDVMAAVFSFLSILFTFITALILGIFILFWDTPIVRANNRNLSFVLLVSIMLSFLCVFLFLGRPVDITCMLRQTAFGIIFSVAMSCILAKTVMVCIAFNATKPGSYWRKFLGVKVPNCIVLICSSVQVLISIMWWSISPPFQELDMHSYQGKIIIQCNEGSVIAFYCVLGYMGLLAAVSFIIAFLARTLPDSFNEAKYITFSMLVFCSVWIAMIPAYLSTKGKNMVAVEIFAILASNSGILGCIFFHKCYVILLKRERNARRGLFGYSQS